MKSFAPPPPCMSNSSYFPNPFEIKANKDKGTISFWGGKWRQVEPLLFRLVDGQLDNGETVVSFLQDQNGQITQMFNGIWTHEKLSSQKSQRTQKVNLCSQILNAYVGGYEIAPNRLITITLEGGKLMGGMPEQAKVELSPVSETRFVVPEADAEVNFFKDEQGQITHLVLPFNGKEMRGQKVK